MKKKIIRYGILISLTLLVVVFWHRHVDIHQCRLLLNKFTQSRSFQKSVDSPDNGEHDAVIHTHPASPFNEEENRIVSNEEENRNASREGENRSASKDEENRSTPNGEENRSASEEEENRSAFKGEENKIAPSNPNPSSPGTSQENASSEKVPSEAEEINRTKTAIRADKKGKDEGTGYYIKVYSSVVKDDAEKTGVYLTQMKYSPKIIREPGFAMMRNVYVTPDSQGIQKTVDRLTSDGFSVYLQKDEKYKENQYTIRAGSCYYLESAKSLLKSLKYKGYSGNIVLEKTVVKFYSVFLGTYSDYDAALEEQKQLNLKGFPAAVITSGMPASDT